MTTKLQLIPRVGGETSVQSALDAHVSAEVSVARVEGTLSAPDHWSEQLCFRKQFPRLPHTSLPRVSVGDVSLASALQARRSCRTFSNEPNTTIAKIAGVLEMAVAVATGTDSRAHRPYPSAGARYPTEIYLVVRDVEGLPRGVYYYDAWDHCVVTLLEGIPDGLAELFGDEMASTASLVVVLTSAVYRSCLKYAGRGYRYALIEVGAVAQSIDLCCRAEGLGACWLGGFADRAVAELLDLSWELELEAPILCMAIGPPPP